MSSAAKSQGGSQWLRRWASSGETVLFTGYEKRPCYEKIKGARDGGGLVKIRVLKVEVMIGPRDFFF